MKHCSGGFAASFAAMIYLGGFLGAFHSNESWGHFWRAWLWPGYVAYVELDKYFTAKVRA